MFDSSLLLLCQQTSNLRLLTTTVYEKLMPLQNSVVSLALSLIIWFWRTFEKPKHIDIVDSDRFCIIYYKLNIKHHYREDDTHMLFVIITK